MAAGTRAGSDCQVRLNDRLPVYSDIMSHLSARRLVCLWGKRLYREYESYSNRKLFVAVSNNDRCSEPVLYVRTVSHSLHFPRRIDVTFNECTLATTYLRKNWDTQVHGWTSRTSCDCRQTNQSETRLLFVRRQITDAHDRSSHDLQVNPMTFIHDLDRELSCVSKMKFVGQVVQMLGPEQDRPTQRQT